MLFIQCFSETATEKHFIIVCYYLKEQIWAVKFQEKHTTINSKQAKDNCLSMHETMKQF